MKDRRRRAPQLETLEPLVLLSHVSVRHEPPTRRAPHAEVAPAALLTGTADGTFFAQQGSPQSGTIYRIFASGAIAPGKPALLVGGVQSRGFAANGAGGGNLIAAFKSGPGSLVLRLTETASPAPGRFLFTYRATNGSETGTITLSLQPINTNIHGEPVSNPGFFGDSTLTFQPGA